MDIKKIIEDLVKKIKDDKALQETFMKNPKEGVEKLLGIDIPDEAVEGVVNGVKAKLGAEKLEGALDGLKKLF